MSNQFINPDPADPQTISVAVPARTEFLQMLRLVLAGVAGEVFDIDEVDDLKIAVEEFAALLIAAGGDDPHLHLQLAVVDAAVEVAGHRDLVGGAEPDLGEHLPLILEAVVDEYHVGASGGTARFSFRKRHRGG